MINKEVISKDLQKFCSENPGYYFYLIVFDEAIKIGISGSGKERILSYFGGLSIPRKVLLFVFNEKSAKAFEAMAVKHNTGSQCYGREWFPHESIDFESLVKTASEHSSDGKAWELTYGIEDISDNISGKSLFSLCERDFEVSEEESQFTNKDQISIRIPPKLHRRIKDTCPHGLTRSQWINVLIGERLDSLAKYSGDRWKPKPRMQDQMADGNLRGGETAGSAGDFTAPESYA